MQLETALSEAAPTDASLDEVRPTGVGLSVSGLHKAFGTQRVLKGLGLEVAAGSLTAILGPSGSGKTTLLRVVAGFERADLGTVSIGGTVVNDADGVFVPPERRRVGYVPQEGGLFPHLTVARNVAFGMSKARRRAGAVGELLELVGMAEMARRYPHELSGGQQHRVALARALAVEPALVLLDEPFSSLEAGLRADVRAEVKDVLRLAGATALLVTHDQDEALSWSDQVAVIRRGLIGQLDSPERIYTTPVDPGLASFVGEANLLPGTADDSGVATPLGHLEVAGRRPAAGSRAVVLVRPEQLVLVRGSGDDDAPHGIVVGYEYYGHDAVVRVAIPGSSSTLVGSEIDGPGNADGPASIGVPDASRAARPDDVGRAVGPGPSTGGGWLRQGHRHHADHDHDHDHDHGREHHLARHLHFHGHELWGDHGRHEAEQHLGQRLEERLDKRLARAGYRRGPGGRRRVLASGDVELVVRVVGGGSWELGSDVAISVQGPVRAWPSPTEITPA